MLKTNNKFEDSKDNLEAPDIDMDINVAAKNEHVGNMERPMQTSKERWQAHNARSPIKKSQK